MFLCFCVCIRLHKLYICINICEYCSVYIYIYCMTVCVYIYIHIVFWATSRLGNIQFKQPTPLLMQPLFWAVLNFESPVRRLRRHILFQWRTLIQVAVLAKHQCIEQNSFHLTSCFQHSPIIPLRKSKEGGKSQPCAHSPVLLTFISGPLLFTSLYTLYFSKKSHQSATLCPCMLIYSRHRTHHFVSASNGSPGAKVRSVLRKIRKTFSTSTPLTERTHCCEFLTKPAFEFIWWWNGGINEKNKGPLNAIQDVQ